MVEQFETLKEAILKSEKFFVGGRAELARRMGMTYDQFRNRLEEKNGNKPFDAQQLEDIQFITGTSHIAQYYANKAHCILIKSVPTELDSAELSEIQIAEMAAIGEMNVAIADALKDGEIDEKEAKTIKDVTMKAVSKILNGKLSTISVYRSVS